MAKSQHPKKTTRKRRNRRKNSEPFYKHGQIFRLKTDYFERLKTNDDFVALVRVQRMHNALVYSLGLFEHDSGVNSPLATRHRLRTSFTSAGFLAEAAHVIDSLRSSYRTEPFYEAFLQSRSATHVRNWKIVKEIRNHVAFHLDKHEDITKATLATLKLTHYDFISGDENKALEINFQVPDLVDINYIASRLNDNPDTDTLREIFTAIIELNRLLLPAADSFILGISEKLGLFPVSEP
jgi:hypothetical protein